MIANKIEANDINNVVEVEGIEVIEATLLNNVSGGTCEGKPCSGNSGNACGGSSQ